MKVSDYIMNKVAELGVSHVFLVSGGGGMFLLDSLGKNKKLKYICNHHEQASVMAAEGYQRATGNIGVALVTTGPAATNTLTGILCSWNDSIPLLVISGQANSKFLIKDTLLRQRGVHEVDIVKIVKSVTKYAVTILDENNVKYELEKALYMAKSGRPGPVLLDIPIDIQSKEINIETLLGFEEPYIQLDSFKINNQITDLALALQQSKRPIILAGHGIRLSGQIDNFFNFCNRFNIPVVTTKNAMDIVHDDYELLAGRVGTYGQRAGNFAMQNADLILSLGSRLSQPTTGYEFDFFAREAKVYVVDIDDNQLKYTNIKTADKINCDLNIFFEIFSHHDLNYKANITWLRRCQEWRMKYPAVTDEMKNRKDYVNSYYFFEQLSKYMSCDDYLVTDQGATFYSFTVAFKLKKNQRAFTNGGFSPMGYGLPSAIGAVCSDNSQRVVCVHGDGGLMMNLQELETIKHNKLPIILFVFNNDGYLSIKHTQNSYFDGHYVGSDPSSGVSMPKWSNVANTFEMPYFCLNNHDEMDDIFSKVFEFNSPVLIEVMIDPLQPYEPRVATSKRQDGSLKSNPLEDMSPLLDRDEFDKEMIVKPIE